MYKSQKKFPEWRCSQILHMQTDKVNCIMFICVGMCERLPACVNLFSFIKKSPSSCQHVAQDDKSPLTIYSSTALHCVAGAMFSSLYDTEASGLPAKLSLPPKWSSHFQGERLHGITHFVLGITFSLPVWLPGMDMAGWL